MDFFVENFNVTVIMTVKNGAEFVSRSLNSITEQSYQPSEVVIIDDGSTDDTCLQIERFIKKTDLPIKLISTEGVGRAKALNLAVINSSGNWIANLDVDDYWFPIKLEQQVKCLSENVEGCLFATGTTIHIEGEPDKLLLENDSNFEFIKYKELEGKDFYIRNPINHSSVLFKKELFNAVGCYDEKLTKQIDIDLWRRFLGLSEHMYVVEAPLTIKYLHSKQSFEAKNVVSYRINSLKIKLKILRLLSAPFRYYLLALVVFLGQFIPRRLKEHLKSCNLYPR